MAKLVLGKNQLETLEEMMNIAINAMDESDSEGNSKEFEADQKRYIKLQQAIDSQLAKQAN